ncbi:MAG: DNA alkylation repair protein [Deferribacteres bacterium]|nr:DNA alkylation repair protein [candidate division KSB1 bacterium]MCB9504376.1 DNA alkylation repair protein [Deferribacteres bacterium]
MAEPFKELFNQKFVTDLESAIHKVHPSFNTGEFQNSVLDENWADRELKQRMRHISESLRPYLPSDYVQAIDILKNASEGFSGLAHIVFADFVEVFGLDHFDASVNALELFTQNSSAEFAVRPFIVKYPQEMMQQMGKWARASNEHLRRLSSEGCRPRLPWAMALPVFKKDPSPVLKILELLKNDPSEYVRKSVANNLNDISKDHPEIVLKTAGEWLNKTAETDWIVKHGCRTLLRVGNTKALLLFGYQEPDHVEITELCVTPSIKLGESIDFNFTITADNGKLGKLRLEYIIEFMKANGKTSPKIFKISEGIFTVKQRQITKSHSFRPITTRKYYPGKHGLRIVINGTEKSNTEFVVFE